MGKQKELYRERDTMEQGQHYVDHVQAMTKEGLHSKSDIAAELAHRDIVIKRLWDAALGATEQFSDEESLINFKAELMDARKPT